MSVTVQVADTEGVRLTENTVEPEPPDRLAFSVRGRLTVTEVLLAQFEGATLNPVRIAVSAADETGTVDIDLTGSATLRLEAVDVGVATPDRDDVANGLGALRRATDDDPDPTDAQPDVIAFTVEGEVRDVPAARLEAIPDEDSEIESVTFAVEESLRSDGGSNDEPSDDGRSGDDVLFELTLFGYGIVVRRDGTIVVGSDGGLAGIDRP